MYQKKNLSFLTHTCHRSATVYRWTLTIMHQYMCYMPTEMNWMHMNTF